MNPWPNLIPLARRMQFPLRLIPLFLVLSLICVLFEAASIAMLMPIFEILSQGGGLDATNLEGWHWDLFRRFSDLSGIPINLAFLLIVSFTLLCLRQAATYANTLVRATAKRRTADRIRRRCFKAFLRAGTGVQNNTKIGEITNRLTIELNRALQGLFSIVVLIGNILQALVYLAGLFMLSTLMTTLSIGIVVLSALVFRKYIMQMGKAGAMVTRANSALSTFLVDRLKQIRLIRLSGTTQAEVAAFGKLSYKQANKDTQHKLLATRLTLLPEPIILGIAYLLLYLGSVVLGLGVETLGLFLIFVARLMPLVRKTMADYSKIAGNWASVENVDQWMSNVLSAKEHEGGDEVLVSLDRQIEYRDVSIRYEDTEAPALSRINTSVPAHAMSALVGPSGAGKSTFVDLLPRLWVPNSGKILFDDIPVESFSVNSLRSGIAFVPQSPQIFNISAAEHIRYGKEDATDEEVREAARLAGAVTFIEALPDGFDTLLGDDGSRLSGGQRQRLDIARALVRKAPILILDEPTSALDADAEAAFRDALQTLRGKTDLTIIVIAHRLSTIADADQIIVLNEGHVDASGTHDELIGGDNWYADAYRKQFGAAQAAFGRATPVPG